MHAQFWQSYTEWTHTYLGSGVDLVQIVDELGKILDGVDVVVRGGRDESHACKNITVNLCILCQVLIGLLESWHFVAKRLCCRFMRVKTHSEETPCVGYTYQAWRDGG